MPSIDRIATSCGFGSEENERTRFVSALALAFSLAALPVLLMVLLDTDRSLSLAFLPAVWLARKLQQPAETLDRWLFTWAIAAMLLAAFLAPHAARALAMAASVGCTLAGALVARKLAHSLAAIRLVLVGIVVGAVVGTLMVRIGVGAGEIYFPVYWSARLFGAHQFAGCIASLGLLFLLPPSRGARALTITGAVIVWTGLAWSGSRAPALGVIVAVILWWTRGSPGERRFLIRWVPILGLAGLTLSYPLGTPYPQLGWWDAFARTAEATGWETVTSQRSNFWLATWQHAITSPWVGHGADSYLYLHPAPYGNQPHNVLLQWFLEYGVIGLIPLMGLVLLGVQGPPSNGSLSDHSQWPLRIWSQASLAGAFAYGLFDGVFYHLVVFMPVAIFAGFALGQNSQSPRAATSVWFRQTGGVLLALAIAVLLLHNGLAFMLLRGRNVEPDSPAALVLRQFPSTTYGLPNWLERWHQTHPSDEMEWTKWAAENGLNQGMYHVRAAQIHLRQKDYAAAESELMLCLDKVHLDERNDVLEVLAGVRRRIEEPTAIDPTPDDASR